MISQTVPLPNAVCLWRGVVYDPGPGGVAYRCNRSRKRLIFGMNCCPSSVSYASNSSQENSSGRHVPCLLLSMLGLQLQLGFQTESYVGFPVRCIRDQPTSVVPYECAWHYAHPFVLCLSLCVVTQGSLKAAAPKTQSTPPTPPSQHTWHGSYETIHAAFTRDY